MAEKDDKKADDEKIIPVGPGAEEEVRDETDEHIDDSDADERVHHAEDEDEDEEDVGSRIGDDRNAIKERRREEKRRKKERLKTERVELNFLRQRNEALERRQSEIDARMDQNDVGNIDSRVAMIDGQIAEAESVYAEAITKQNGGAAAEAMKIRDDLRDSKSQLLGAKNQRIQVARQRQAQPKNVDPMISRNVENWLGANTWYDPQLRDEDSRIARAIEDGLFAEGRLDARSPDYWTEYNRRLRKRMPDKFETRRRNGNGRDTDREDDDTDEELDDEPSREREAPRKSRGPRITTGGRERPLKKNEVFISKDRKEAMIEAGVWENPELREKYLKQYSSYDRQHKNDRSR